MNDREFITNIRDQCNTQLAGGEPSPGAAVPKVTAKPSPFADLGNGSGGGSAVAEHQIAPGQVLGVEFQTTAGAKERNLRWFGSPGQFWDRNSWAIFDSGGAVVAQGDNVLVVGNLGFTLDTSVLGKLAPGRWVLGVSVDAPGNLAFQFVQN